MRLVSSPLTSMKKNLTGKSQFSIVKDITSCSLPLFFFFFSAQHMTRRDRAKKKKMEDTRISQNYRTRKKNPD